MTSFSVATFSGFMNTFGIFAAPARGIYWYMVHFRLQDNAPDVTLEKNGVIIAGLGHDFGGTNFWYCSYSFALFFFAMTHFLCLFRASHGVGRHVYLDQGDILTVTLRSGGNTNCLLDTSYNYGQFSVGLYAADRLRSA